MKITIFGFFVGLFLVATTATKQCIFMPQKVWWNMGWGSKRSIKEGFPDNMQYAICARQSQTLEWQFCTENGFKLEQSANIALNPNGKEDDKMRSSGCGRAVS